MQAAIGRLQQLANDAGGNQKGGGGGLCYTIAPVVILAGGSVTGQSVYALQGGAVVTVSTNATVYNLMNVATVNNTGQTIVVGSNGDGTFTAISQSC